MSQQPNPAENPDLAEWQWPTPFKSSESLPDPAALVLAWKPLINGWDIILGREIATAPAQYTHWLSIPPAPECHIEDEPRRP